MRTAYLPIALILAFAMPATAQQNQPSPEQIQQMINQAQQQGGGRIKIDTNMIMAAMGMSKCMQEKVGEEGMQKMADAGKALNEKVKPLCAAGQRDEAMELQVDFARSMMKTPEYAGMRACADKFKSAFKGPEFADIRAVMDNPEQTDKHICDYQQS